MTVLRITLDYQCDGVEHIVITRETPWNWTGDPVIKAQEFADAVVGALERVATHPPVKK